MYLNWAVFLLCVLCLAVADDKAQDVATKEPLPDVEPDRRPAVRTNVAPHLPASYDGLPLHHDLKTLGSSDYAYTYPGVNGGSAYEHFNGGSYEHGGHHDHYHVVEDHGQHDSDEYHITSRDIAFGFLTFMVILTNLQSGLINLSKNSNLLGVITSRKRRDAAQLHPMNELSDDDPLPFQTKLDDKKWLLLEDKQVRCVQHSVCTTNRQLLKDLGSTGKALGHYLNRLVAKSVDAEWARLVADAGAAGLAGVDCSVLYRGCHAYLDTEPN